MPIKNLQSRYVINPKTKSYTGYKNIIMLKLEALLGQDSTALFTAVYGVNEPESNGYPCAFVLERTGQGSILDTHRNEREWQFSIVIHQSVSQKNPKQSYEALLDATDRVITSFDTDPMLYDSNGQARCKWARVVPVEFEFSNQDTPVHRALLTIGVLDIVNRYVP